MTRVLALCSSADVTGSVKQFDLALPHLRGGRFDVVRHALPADVRRVLNEVKPDLLHTLGAEAFRAVRKLTLARVKLPRWLAAGAASVEPMFGFTPGLTATFSQSEHDRDWAARLTPAPMQFSGGVGIACSPRASRAPVTVGTHDSRSERFTILASGGFNSVANLKHVVWAFDALRYAHPTLRLVLLGDGPERQNLERFARTLGIEPLVHFAAFQPDITPFLRSATLAWGAHTRGGTKFLREAMASGLPVIATDTPDARMVVTAGATGELVPVDRPVEMAKAAHRLLTDPVRREARAVAGQAAASRHPVADLAEALAGVYHTLTSSAPPRPE